MQTGNTPMARIVWPAERPLTIRAVVDGELFTELLL
jgi:hypothetical protein